MRSAFLDKILGRLDRLQPGEVQQFLLRLAADKRQLETIFNALQEGVIITDAEGVMNYANPAACRFFGLDPENFAGRPLMRHIPGLAWEELAQQERVVTRDLEVFYPENRYLNFYVLPLNQGETGKRATKAKVKTEVEGYALIVRDTTEDRRSTVKMVENEQFSALTMLAAGVAHEIGNPLNSLNIHLQLMERKLRNLPPGDRADLEELVEVSRGEVKRLDFIITQFLRALRPTPPHLVSDAVNPIIEESVSFLAPEIRDRDILVEQELREGLPLVPLDRDQLKQAFYNLIRNSLQSMNAGGILRIRTDVDDAHVRISFRDNGGGISAEAMSKIFNPFFTTKSTGTGLGLLIVRRIVRDHGGEIEIDSNEGVGTTVTILLPLPNRHVRMLTQEE
jgi:two-component system, sporulation sensor kinase E